MLASVVQRGDPGPGVLHHKSMSLKGGHAVFPAQCQLSFLLFLSTLLSVLPFLHLKTNISSFAVVKWLKEDTCLSVSADALLQTQQSRDYCNLFLGTVPIYQE